MMVDGKQKKKLRRAKANITIRQDQLRMKKR